MKRTNIFIVALVSCMVFAVLALTACGGGSSSSSASTASTSSSTTAASSSTSSAASSSASSSAVSLSDMSENEVRSVFEQAVASMSEFYKGSSQASEGVYYAGAQAGQNSILAFVEPETQRAASFIGPATVSESGLVTIKDETTGNSMTFAVIANEDGTLTFDMGDTYGKATMSECSSTEIVDILTQISMYTSSASNQ